MNRPLKEQFEYLSGCYDEHHPLSSCAIIYNQEAYLEALEIYTNYLEDEIERIKEENEKQKI